MKKIILASILFLFVGFGSIAQDNQTKEYDYVTIMVDDKRPYEIYLSYSDGTYEEEKMKPEGKFDYTGVLSVISQKEKEGYEIYSNHFSTFMDINKPHWMFLMRKEK